jgi:hypothetical protein
MQQTEATDLIKQAMYSTKLSRLLAQENIGVSFSNTAATASFSPVDRTLTFPYSTAFMDHDIHELFMMHEVSHAIHLPVDSIEQVRAAGIDHGMFNIVVDIRDERLIKEKYPGTIKSFVRGYEKLLEQGFFGKKNRINALSFADRLNVYAKLGITTGHFVRLNPTEHAFYEECMKATSFKEVMDLSRRLELADKNNFNRNQISEMLADEIEEITSQLNADGEPMSAEAIQQELDELIRQIEETRLQDLFDKNFQQTVMSNVHIVTYQSLSKNNVYVSKAKWYTDSVADYYNNIHQSNYDSLELVNEIRESRKLIKTSVDSMVRVFESKKSAQKYRDAKVSQTGLIDINKVHRYKFDDKIFRSVTKMPNSKNHAYYIMIDMSGSIYRNFNDVVEQIVVITEFFRRIQVPYKVVGFGASVEFSNKKDFGMPYDVQVCPSIVSRSGSEFLFELFTSEQTTHEHNLTIKGLLSRVRFSFGSTPTGFAMLTAEQDAMKFFTNVKADKKHMVVMTDGQPTDLSALTYSVRGKTMLVTDAVTKKHITTKGNSPYGVINAIGKIFTNRYNINFTTISISNKLSDSVVSAFVSSGVSPTAQSDWTRKGFTSVVDPYSTNTVFFAKPFSVESEVGAFDVDETMSAAKIAQAMARSMKQLKKSRNFLNTLAETLS